MQASLSVSVTKKLQKALPEEKDSRFSFHRTELEMTFGHFPHNFETRVKAALTLKGLSRFFVMLRTKGKGEGSL